MATNQEVILTQSGTANATMRLKLWFTVGEGYITVTGMAGARDSYGPTEDHGSNTRIFCKINGVSQTLVPTLYSGSSPQIYFAKNTSSDTSKWTYTTFWTGNCTQTGVSGATNIEITFQAHNTNSNITNSKFIQYTATAPTLSDVTVSNITATSASGSVTITSNGGAAIVDTYIDCSTSNTFPAGSVKTITGSSGTWTGLTNNTTYYVRANASNGIYRGYSATTSFTTGSAVTTPTLSNVTITNVTTTGASASFTVTDDGGAPIVSNYIDANIDNTFPAPQASTISGTSGSFSGLSPGTLYYIRANASNGTNTGYSNITSLSTSPTVTISPTSNADGRSVVLNRVIGGSTSATYYNLYDANGTALVTNAAEGSTVSGYTFNAGVVSGLTPGTRYGFSVKATYTAGAVYNSAGTTTAISYLTTTQLSAVNLSENGGAFTPRNLYISINGGAFTQVPKDKLIVL